MKGKILTIIFVFLATAGGFAQNCAVLDYPIAFMLHPLMGNYRFSRGCFEKAPLLVDKNRYNDWLRTANKQIEVLKKKHANDLKSATSKVENLKKQLLKVAGRNSATILSLSRKFDKLRQSNKAEDKAILERMNYGKQISEFEKRYAKEKAKFEVEIRKAQSELESLKQLINSPRYTTNAETRRNFETIKSEIIHYAQYLMKQKNCSILLNRSTIGSIADNKPVEKIDSNYLGNFSDQQIELYKRLLSESPEPPSQDAPNEDYRNAIREQYKRNRVGRFRRTLTARSALRLIEPEINPLVLSGGTPITIDVVNSILFHYKVSDANRGFIAQALREMGIK